MFRSLVHVVLVVVIGGLGIACDNAGSSAPSVDPDYDERILTYRGEAKIKEVVELTQGEGYIFYPESGPQCIDGSEYWVGRADGATNTDNFVFFMQGGGACWSEKCLATGSAGNPGLPLNLFSILSQDPALNTFADYHKIYLPYCDGSLFGGDAEYDDDGDMKLDRIHRGIQNLTAGIDIAKEYYPNPERILITGVSAGGFGTIMATTVIRAAYPDAELMVFNDSGVGVLYGEENIPFLEARINEWNINRLIPDSCKDCLETGHLTPFFRWQLRHDPNLRIATFSHLRDLVISSTFLEMDPLLWQSMLIAEHAKLHQQFPNRFNSFLVDGSSHTSIGPHDSYVVNGVTLYDWLGCFHHMDNSCWKHLVAEPSEP